MVSAIIVARNSAQYIVNCIQSIQRQFLDTDTWELIIVDGKSTDGTKRLAIEYLETTTVDYHIFDNEKLTLSTGWNLAVREAKGEYVVRPDAHATLLPDYIKNGLSHLHSDSSLAGVGGTLITKAESFIGEIIAIVLSNPIGVGPSLFRVGVSKDTYTDTAVYAVYRKDAFCEVGGLNESLTRNQDIDFHKRILDNGYRLMTACDMKAEYYSRTTLYKFLKQGWLNGYWITKGETRHLKHLVPMSFCIALIITPLFHWKLILLLLLIYFCLAIGSFIVFSNLFNPIKLIIALTFTLMLHLAYGFGSIYGLLRRVMARAE